MSLFKNESNTGNNLGNDFCKININIKKDYLTVSEVASLWNVPLEDIRYLGERGELSISIRHIPVRIAIESILNKMPYRENFSRKSKEIVSLLNCPQALQPADIYLLFSNHDRKIKITKFKTKPVMNIIKILSPEIEVGFDDMIITASEIKRFEFEHSNLTKIRNKNTNNETEEPIILLSKDFSIFKMYDEEFKFGEKQALVIKHLYDRYSVGDPWTYGKKLLAQAGSASWRLANLFNRNSNWKKIIISNGRGYYRINLPFSGLGSENINNKLKNEDLPILKFIEEANKESD